MATINIPASALAFVKRGDSSSWSYAGAMQGVYSGGYPRVGAMRFATVHQIDWREQVISEIRLVASFAVAGGNYAKTLGLYRATRSGIGGTGNGIIGQYLGSTGTNGAAYNAMRTMYFNANSQPALFANLVAWLQSMSVDTLALYMGDGSPSGSYSANYLQITAATLSIDYEPVGSKGTLDKTEVIAGSDVVTLTIEPIEDEGIVTHGIAWRIGGVEEGGIQLPANVHSTSFAVPIDWCSQITDSEAGTAECVLTTYVDDVEKSSRAIPFTVRVPEDIVPEFTASIAPYDTTGGYYQFIGGAQISALDAASPYGASITEYGVTGSENVNASGQNAVINTPKFQQDGDHSYSITVTDSRGRKTTKTVECTVAAVYAPSITSFTVRRYSTVINDAGEPEYADDFAGGKVRVSMLAGADPAGGNNTITARIVWNEVGGAESHRVNLAWPSGLAQLEYENERSLITADIPLDSAYEFTLYITDEHTGATAYARVEKGWTAVHVSENGYGVGVGGYVMDGTPEAPVFRSYYPAQFVAGIDGVTNYAAGQTLTGGKWIDGKPIYRQVVEIGYIAVGGKKIIPVNLNGGMFETLISMRGMVRMDAYNGTWVSVPYADYDANWVIPITIYGSENAVPEVTAYANKLHAITAGYVVIEYTLKE